MSGFASSRSLSSSRRRRASCSSGASSSMSMALPIRRRCRPSIPSLDAAERVASPAGSSTEGRRCTRTRALKRGTGFRGAGGILTDTQPLRHSSARWFCAAQRTHGDDGGVALPCFTSLLIVAWPEGCLASPCWASAALLWVLMPLPMICSVAMAINSGRPVGCVSRHQENTGFSKWRGNALSFGTMAAVASACASAAMPPGLL